MAFLNAARRHAHGRLFRFLTKYDSALFCLIRLDKLTPHTAQPQALAELNRSEHSAVSAGRENGNAKKEERQGSLKRDEGLLKAQGWSGKITARSASERRIDGKGQQNQFATAKQVKFAATGGKMGHDRSMMGPSQEAVIGGI